MKCHVRIAITRLRVTNIAIHCKTLHNPTLVVCYFYNQDHTMTLRYSLTILFPTRHLPAHPYTMSENYLHSP